jgi:hypothetical protein
MFRRIFTSFAGGALVAAAIAVSVSVPVNGARADEQRAGPPALNCSEQFQMCLMSGQPFYVCLIQWGFCQLTPGKPHEQ